MIRFMFPEKFVKRAMIILQDRHGFCLGLMGDALEASPFM